MASHCQQLKIHPLPYGQQSHLQAHRCLLGLLCTKPTGHLPALPWNMPRALLKASLLMPSCLEHSAPSLCSGLHLDVCLNVSPSEQPADHSVTSLFLHSSEEYCSHSVLILVVHLLFVPLEFQLLHSLVHHLFS